MVQNMSSISNFCFMTFCVNLPLNPSQKMVQNTMDLYDLDRSIESINENFKFIEYKLKVINERDIFDVLYNAWNDTFHKHANPALQAVWDAMIAARNKGKASFNCYAIATRIIDEVMTRGYDVDIDPCKTNFVRAVWEIRQKAKPLNGIINRVQYIFITTVPGCYNSTDAVKCLDRALWNIKELHKDLETIINPLIREQETSYPKLKNDFKTCIAAIGTNIESVACVVQREGIRCAETAGTPIDQST